MGEPRDTGPMNLGNPIGARRTPPEDWGGGGDHFAAPLGSSTSGRVRFTNGAHQVIIRADLHLRGLYRARFGERMPTVWVQGGTVTIRYPQVPFCDWLNHRSERPAAEVALNACVPWNIEIRGSASRLVADLRGGRLGSFSLDGGASHLEVVLPAPSGTVAVIILGGASNVAIRRPTGVAARLRVDGGATLLKFDDRSIGAAGGELDLRGWDYEGVADRYDITITGGVNNVSVTSSEQQQAKARGVGVRAEPAQQTRSSGLNTEGRSGS
ncbi:MAG TPA: hypothetical protein VI027_01180 [Rubrobacteraceae bacterium]